MEFAGISLITVALFLTSVSAWAERAQTAETLSQVERIYVGSLGTKQGASSLREKLIQRLSKARGIKVVTNPSEADAIITGSGEVWLKGYIRTNPKPSPYNRQPVYDGYLSVELKGKDSVTLWSGRATPGGIPVERSPAESRGPIDKTPNGQFACAWRVHVMIDSTSNSI